MPEGSRCPTFASVLLEVDNDRWAGVPFLMKVGASQSMQQVWAALRRDSPDHLGLLLENTGWEGAGRAQGGGPDPFQAAAVQRDDEGARGAAAAGERAGDADPAGRVLLPQHLLQGLLALRLLPSLPLPWSSKVSLCSGSTPYPLGRLPSKLS